MAAIGRDGTSKSQEMELKLGFLCGEWGLKYLNHSLSRYVLAKMLELKAEQKQNPVTPTWDAEITSDILTTASNVHSYYLFNSGKLGLVKG